MFKKIFNFNTGYFINETLYWYNGKLEIGYVLCKGYILFGLFGYDRINVFVDKTEANNALNQIKLFMYGNNKQIC
jgi:hypothetical protein